MVTLATWSRQPNNLYRKVPAAVLTAADLSHTDDTELQLLSNSPGHGGRRGVGQGCPTGSDTTAGRRLASLLSTSHARQRRITNNDTHNPVAARTDGDGEERDPGAVSEHRPIVLSTNTCDNTEVRVRFTRAARSRHRIAPSRARYVMATVRGHSITTNKGNAGVLWIGADQDGNLLEVIAAVEPGELIVTHVMPRRLREQR